MVALPPAGGNFYSYAVHNLAFLGNSYPNYICPVNSSLEEGTCDFCNFREKILNAMINISAYNFENAVFLLSIYENLAPDIETIIPVYIGEGNPSLKDSIDPFYEYDLVMLILNSQQRNELYKHLPGVKIKFAPFNVYLSSRTFWARSVDAGEFGTISSWIFEDESPTPPSLAESEEFSAQELIRDEDDEDENAETPSSSETALRNIVTRARLPASLPRLCGARSLGSSPGADEAKKADRPLKGTPRFYGPTRT